MTQPRKAPLTEALRLIAYTRSERANAVIGDATICDYAEGFDELWNLEKLSANHVIVVWVDTPDDPDVRPVVSERHLTPFDWAIAACSQHKDLRVTVIDLRAKEHDSEGYAALQWLRTQRPECLPWLRRLIVKDFLEVTGAEGVRSLFVQRPATTPGTPVVDPRDVLPLLPVCRVDFTREASHHAIANLIGPLLLMRNSTGKATRAVGNPSHPMALRHLLVAAGFVRNGSRADDTAKLADRAATIRNIIGDGVGEVRLILCDDQWNHGWLAWLCERTGTKVDDHAVTRARDSPDGSPQRVATGEGISIWVASGPKWLVAKLKGASSGIPPVQRRLCLTDDESRNEVLLLDLRLFTGRNDDEQDFVRQLRRLHVALSGATDPAADPQVPAMTDGEPTAEVLCLLPRALAVVDPLLPIVLFSSTGRRDVIEIASELPSVVTVFAKPRLLGSDADDVRATAEEALDHALQAAAALVRRRRVVTDLQAARARLAPVGAHRVTCGYVGIYVDESGAVQRLNEPFAMCGVLAMYPNPRAAKAFRDQLAKELRWVHATEATQAQRESIASQVNAIATQSGVILRGIAVMRGALPEGPRYGSNALWAETALDRVHRVLLKQVVRAALQYVVRSDEVARDAQCEVLTDVRSVPLAQLPLNPRESLKFGIEVLDAKNAIVSRSRVLRAKAVPQDWKWAFLDTSGVYPIVEDLFLEERTLRARFSIAEARACRGLFDGGHPLVEWADFLANAVFRAHRGTTFDPDRLEQWAADLLKPPGVLVTYNAAIDRLIELACMAAGGQPEIAVEKLVRLPDKCTDTGPQSLADRCRARIADELERCDAWVVGSLQPAPRSEQESLSRSALWIWLGGMHAPDSRRVASSFKPPPQAVELRQALKGGWYAVAQFESAEAARSAMNDYRGRWRVRLSVA